MQPKLSVKIGKLKIKNPVMVASGTFGYAEEFKNLVDLKNLGAVVTKTITLKPREGNFPPRTCETPAGMLNSVGLENPGINKFISQKIPLLKKIGPPVIVSIAAEDDPEEFIELARQLDKVSAVSAIEINISCPNIKIKDQKSHKSAKLISQDCGSTYDIVKAVRKVTSKVLITKLSPNVTSIAEIAQAAEEAGSDALALINTLAGLCVDIDKRCAKLGGFNGGLSGPAIRPVAVNMVWEVYQKTKLPIIGMGGIIDTQSALEFFIAGASAVAVGTANFINPNASVEIIEGIEQYLQKNRISSISKLTGSLECRI